MRISIYLRLAIVLFLIVTTGVCRAQEKVVLSNPNYKLTADEMNYLAEKAYAGDAEAALRISGHFTYQPSEKKRKKSFHKGAGRF